jgi:hypothetical protein
LKHPSLHKWEKKLRTVFGEIDQFLEEKYGHTYPLHPVRRRRRKTGNPKQDGLFRLDGAFSAGFGSEHGRGYIVKIEMITLAKVPEDVRKKIENDAAKKLRSLLSLAFPGQDLKVRRDHGSYKIHGDLGLGELKG